MTDWNDWDIADQVPIPVTLGEEYPELRHLSWLALESDDLAPYVATYGGDLLLAWLEKVGTHVGVEIRTVGDLAGLTAESMIEAPGIGAGKRDKICAFAATIAGGGAEDPRSPRPARGASGVGRCGAGDRRAVGCLRGQRHDVGRRRGDVRRHRGPRRGLRSP